MTKLFDPPDEETIYSRYLQQMKELERLAKKPCEMTQEQWDAYQRWQEHNDDG